MPRFTLEDGETMEVAVNRLIIAGWAGRDPDAIETHISELQALGVTPPSQTPLFYRANASLATTAEMVEVLGEHTSGEVEVVLLGTPRGTGVSVGSDHTDRQAESWSVAHAKQVCPKPLAPQLWWLTDVLPHWDELRLHSRANVAGKRVRYQSGSVAELLPPAALLEQFGSKDRELAAGTAMFCGTLPTLHGPRPATRFEMTLDDPVRGRRIEHAYEVRALPVVS